MRLLGQTPRLSVRNLTGQNAKLQETGPLALSQAAKRESSSCFLHTPHLESDIKHLLFVSKPATGEDHLKLVIAWATIGTGEY
jgi:hypothetical protein